MQLLLVIVLAVGAYWYWNSTRGLSDSERKRVLWRAAMIAGAVLLVLLVASGRLHIFAALGAVLLASLRRLPMLIKLWPFLRKLRDHLGSANGTGKAGPAGSAHSARKPYKGGMSLDEARRILDIDPGADEREITQAHRRLMQKVHPDRGGSDDLAARVNEAKARLMAEITPD